MSTAGTILVTAAGVALVGTASRDIFASLFHPEGRAVLARVEMRVVWRLFRRLGARRPRTFALAGPAALLTVIVSWATLMAVGWALIYLGRRPACAASAPLRARRRASGSSSRSTSRSSP